jgi:integrase
MDSLKEHLHTKRPSLSNSSLTTYTSILKNLYIKVFGDDKLDLKKFDDTEKILAFLKDVPPNKRKTILSSLVIITDKKQYRDLMLEDVRDYNKEIHKQEKTPEQEESWVSTNQVKEIWEGLKKDAELLYKKNSLKPTDLQQIQSYIILSLLGGVFIPPRRSKDYVDFVIKDVDKTKDNYLDKNKMYFNSYKTAKTYGQQVVEIPKSLQAILKKWISVNPTKSLLFDANMNTLSSVKLNQRLNKIFDEKKVSVNALRHSYLTDKYANHSKEGKQLAEDMKEMGSSTNMAVNYIKLD